MKVIKMFLAVLLMLTCLTPDLIADEEKEADQVIGIWYNQEKDAKIKIFKKNGKYLGKIIWLKNPNEDDGTPKVDDENDDPDKQTRPILGLLIVWDFIYDGDNEWDDGYIYNPRDGDTYSCVMTLSKDGNTLEVTGYIGFSFIGKTNIWTRAKS